MRKKEGIILFIMVAVIILVSITASKSLAEDASDLSIVGVELSSDAMAYLDERAPVFLSDLKENSTFYSFECKNTDNLILGDPITIYHSSDGIVSESVTYYIPVYEDEQMVYSLVLLTDTTEEGNMEYGMQTTSNLVDELNYLAQQCAWSGQCYLVGAGEDLYAINDSKEINLTKRKVISSMVNSEYTIGNKTSIIAQIDSMFHGDFETIEENELFTEGSIESEVNLSQSNVFSTRAATNEKILFSTGSSYGIEQEEDGACWMACIATTGKYVRRSENLTWNIRDMYWGLGMEFATGGGEKAEVRSILRRYLLKYDYKTYSILNKSTIWDIIVDGIDNGYPILLRGDNTVWGSDINWHMITIVGYNKSKSLVYFWDPKPGQYESVTMGEKFITEGYDDAKFGWEYIQYYTGSSK